MSTSASGHDYRAIVAHDYEFDGRSTNGLCVCGNSKASAIHFPEHNDDEPTRLCTCGHRRHDHPQQEWEGKCRIWMCRCTNFQGTDNYAFDEPTTSHLLAHGQNRNQYTGSEPTTLIDQSEPLLEGLRRQHERWQAEHNDDEPNHDYVYDGHSTNGLCVCGNSKASAIHFPIEGPIPPKPHVHERFKLIYSADMREVVFRICEDCRYGDNEDYWRGWEARGLAKPVKDSH